MTGYWADMLATQSSEGVIRRPCRSMKHLRVEVKAFDSLRETIAPGGASL